MKLRTAVNLVDMSYGILLLPALMSVVVCIISLRGGMLVAGIGCTIILFIAAFLFKKRMINYCLEKCDYPFEFISVLQQMNLVNDVDINWQDDLIQGPDKTKMNTERFLADNVLLTHFGKSKDSCFLCFNEEGIQVEGKSYEWPRITNWEVTEEENRDAMLHIYYIGETRHKRQAFINLEHAKAATIDIRLLVIHYKAKYG